MKNEYTSNYKMQTSFWRMFFTALWDMLKHRKFIVITSFKQKDSHCHKINASMYETPIDIAETLYDLSFDYRDFKDNINKAME